LCGRGLGSALQEEHCRLTCSREQVSLNSKGQIRAHHDDPNEHLMPHNKYQNAEYPDG
jgi:hypothetical protein